ncbi:PQQ-dependent sugar dehydrogenase [Cognatishimia maritima]|uniref:Glucose/arabinose dehydrogenase, beta-propeller fold n=1 Tax=Cognatishimia maritima TaxID=870908 RepID=A0A1M5IS65_9RHOB|nr:PQQ-dependent sugar dehydrogenase [Cognatishimia maritima]SHG31157.1 Glucose/arabinose dehydrogenase, beta-propeller fold [Cognatishimia maritima]
MRRYLALILLLWMPVVAVAQSLDAPGGSVNVDRIASGFKTPWALAFLPDGRFLVTERRGRLYVVTPEGAKKRITGVPDVVDQGQGGLLDVFVPRDFSESGEIFMTFAKAQASGSGTAVARAVLDLSSNQLSDVETIFEISEGSSGGRHYGSRLAEAPDGTLFVTVGDRGDRPSAQDLKRHNGSVLRIAKDGSLLSDNPFANQTTAQPEIWSSGHRNPQGLAFGPDGQLWAVEHGARGGDEINLIRKGANYGWPVIAYGRHYSGGKIGEGTTKPGLAQPAFYWDPSIAPSGLMVYSGDMFPEWRGALLVGSLKFDYISVLNGTPLKEITTLKSPETKRVRDVRQAPDGSIWFISEDRGAIYRLSR